MPAYRFQALDAQGNNLKGIVEADTAKAARGLVRAQGGIPLLVEAIGTEMAAGNGGTGLNKRLFASKIFSGTGMMVWTRQIAGLVSSGLPLERALSALADEADDERQRGLVAALRAEVNAGSTFAKALGQHPQEFPAVYRSVISAGEQSGNLGEVLNRLADDIEEAQALKSKVIGAALYPAIVTVVALCIVTFLVTYVVPQVAGVFAGSKKALPLLTAIMLGVAAFIRSYGWVMVIAIIFIAIGVRQCWTSDRFGPKMDAAWLQVPLFGKLARGYNAARFASTLAMLTGAGVPILRALQAAAETLGNRAMKADALDALILVREGAPLASALDTKKRFPAMIAMFARLGEQTGQLPVMLQRSAKQLSGEVQRRAMQMATILEPLLIVAMGGAVMLIVMAVLLPIIQLNTFVK